MSKDTPFYLQTGILDALLKEDPGDRNELIELVSRALQAKAELNQYFFRRSPHISWAYALAARGFFKDAPALDESNGNFFAPRWEEQEYLIRIAPDVPDLVLQHLNVLNGHGSYYSRAIAALLTCSSETIAEASELLATWIGKPEIFYFISLDIISVVLRIADDAPLLGLRLFEKVIRPIAPPNLKQIDDNIFANTAAVPSFPLDDWAGRTLAAAARALYVPLPGATVDVLEFALQEALSIEGSARADKWTYEQSFWRNAIEDVGDNFGQHYKDELLSVLRDLLLSLSRDDPNTVAAKLETYLTSGVQIFCRLAMYIVAQDVQTFSHLVSAILLKPANLDDYGVQHEFFGLLRAGAKALSGPQLNQVINSILIGPPPGSYDYLLADDEKGEERVAARTRVWIRDRLWMLEEFLHASASEVLTNLVDEFGKPKYPNYPLSHGQSYIVTFESPLSTEEIIKMSDAEIDQFLQTWTPPVYQIGPKEQSLSALGQNLADAVVGNLKRFSDKAVAYSRLHSSFASSLIYMLSAKATSQPSAYDLVLLIGDDVLSDSKRQLDIAIQEDGSWSHVRLALAQVLKKTLSEGKLDLTEQQVTKTAELLACLAYDPDPDLDSDRPSEDWFGKGEPLTVAINHVRPEAVEGLIEAAVKMVGDRERRRLPEEIAAVLTEKVDFRNDSSLAVHSVFGRELARLFWLDDEWVRANLDYILPLADDQTATSYFVAAWDCWLLHHKISTELFDLLRTRYERAIRNVSRGLISRTFNPVNALAHHLLIEHHFRRVPLRLDETSLVVRYFEETGPEHRGEATFALSERLSNSPNDWKDAKDIWQWRYENALSKGFPAEFLNEMVGLSSLLRHKPDDETIRTLWPLLEGFLPYLDNADRWNRIWSNLENFLSAQGARFPVEVLRYYGLMHDQIKKGRYFYDDGAKSILKLGRLSPQARREAIRVIDKISRSGNYEFKELLDEYLGG